MGSGNFHSTVKAVEVLMGHKESSRIIKSEVGVCVEEKVASLSMRIFFCCFSAAHGCHDRSSSLKPLPHISRMWR